MAELDRGSGWSPPDRWPARCCSMNASACEFAQHPSAICRRRFGRRRSTTDDSDTSARRLDSSEQLFCLLSDQRRVHHCQSLRRHRGDAAFADALSGFRSVKHRHDRKQLAPLDSQVDASTLAVVQHTWPEHRGVEIASGRQQRVADGFRLQSTWLKMPHVAIARIDLQIFRINFVRLLINVAQHDRAMQRFQLPAAANQFRREILQQLRMRRPFALHTKVIRRTDDSLAQMMLPETIDNNSCQQRSGTVFDARSSSWPVQFAGAPAWRFGRVSPVHRFATAPAGNPAQPCPACYRLHRDEGRRHPVRLRRSYRLPGRLGRGAAAAWSRTA